MELLVWVLTGGLQNTQRPLLPLNHYFSSGSGLYEDIEVFLKEHIDLHFQNHVRPEDCGIMFCRNVGIYLQFYTALQPTRQTTTSRPWESEICINFLSTPMKLHSLPLNPLIFTRWSNQLLINIPAYYTHVI